MYQMKTLEFETTISDEDYEAFKNNTLHIRVYYRKDGKVSCVAVPKEKQDMLDQGIFDDIELNKIVNVDVT